MSKGLAQYARRAAQSGGVTAVFVERNQEPYTFGKNLCINVL